MPDEHEMCLPHEILSRIEESGHFNNEAGDGSYTMKDILQLDRVPGDFPC